MVRSAVRGRSGNASTGAGFDDTDRVVSDGLSGPATVVGVDRLRALIQRRSASLTPLQRQLARYLLDHQTEVSFSTANEVGATVGTTGATVVRFAQTLGYAGFSDLRKSMREMLPAFPTFLEQLGSLADQSLSAPADLMRMLLRYEQENLSGTARSLEPQTVREAAIAIDRARSVTLVGSGVGGSIVDLLHGHLSRLRRAVDAPSEAIDTVIALANIGPSDVVIGVSFWRFARTTSEWLQMAKSHGATTIAIVDSPLYPAAQFVDHLLVVRSRNPGHGPSTVAAAAAANILVSAVILTNFQAYFDAIKHLDSAYAEARLYLE